MSSSGNCLREETVSERPPTHPKDELNDFDKLVDLHQRSVYGLAYRLTGRGDVAEDVTQEAFLAAWKNMHRFRGESSFRTWILKITLNKVRSHWRWAKIRNFVSLDGSPHNDEDAGTLGEMIADGKREANPATVFEDVHYEENLQRILMGLSVRQREVITLRAQGLEIREIGALLKLASGTVKAHLFEAKRRLQEKLAAR